MEEGIFSNDFIHHIHFHNQSHRFCTDGNGQKKSRPRCMAHLRGYFIYNCHIGRCLGLHLGYATIPPQDEALVLQIRNACYLYHRSCNHLLHISLTRKIIINTVRNSCGNYIKIIFVFQPCGIRRVGRKSAFHNGGGHLCPIQLP